MQDAPSDFLIPSFSPLVRDYLAHHPDVDALHHGIPHEEALLERHRQRRIPAAIRSALTEVIRQQYSGLHLPQAVSVNLDLLGEETTTTITTGHQLCLATGPLYVVYKMASAIALAARISARADAGKVVPVFWMATEDHDIAEINHAWIGDLRAEWNITAQGPVGNLPIHGLPEAIRAFTEMIPAMPFREEAARILEQSIESGESYARSFRRLVHALFGDHGMIILDASDARLKRFFAPVMEEELRTGIIHTHVQDVNRKLVSLGYEAQVHPRNPNLFLIGEGSRHRLNRTTSGTIAEVDGQRDAPVEEWIRMLREDPGQFSPNVLMRPLYQETILPNLAVVGGPGELAYWLQLRTTFEAFGVQYPYLILRDSFLLVNRKQLQRLHKLGLRLQDTMQDRVALERRMADEAGLTDVTREREAIAAIFDQLAERARQVDPTLEAAARAEGQRQQEALLNMGKRMMRAAKAREEQRITQLHKLLDEWFPEGGPQERHDNYFDHAVRSGGFFHAQLIACADPLDTRIKVVELQENSRVNPATIAE